MKLLHEQSTIPVAVKDITRNKKSNLKDGSSETFEVKEKPSSSASLKLINPVASGDNMAVLESAHKLWEELPPLLPCCEGKELDINQELVRSGLSAISVKHDGVVQCLSLSHACEVVQTPTGLIKHRNSFRSLHRPNLKQVPLLRRMTPDELKTIFRGFAALSIRPVNTGNSTEGVHPIIDTRSETEDVPAGMRLHGAQANIYTSVPTGSKAGNLLDGMSNEEHNSSVPFPEDEVQLTEPLQMILPPRCDDVTAESSNTT